MHKILVLLPILAILSIGSVVFAQESPFGDFNTPEVKLRFFDSVEGLTINDYLSTKENYVNLEEIYERAFGTRKVELEEQILARAKDLVYAKLGGTQTQLLDVYRKSEETGLPSAQTLEALDVAIDAFAEEVPGYLRLVEPTESVDEVIEVNKLANDDIELALDALVPTLSILTVSRGEQLILDIEFKAEVIKEHLIASTDLGGATGDVQEDFEDAMLELEEARDDYEKITLLVGDGSKLDIKTNALNEVRSLLTSSTVSMRKASDGLSKAVDDLRVLYGQSPWEIDVNKFREGSLMEEDIPEDTMEKGVDDTVVMEEDSSTEETQ